MKLRYITFGLLIAGTFLSACDDDIYDLDSKGEAVGEASLVAPGNGADLVLNSGTPDQEITISWEAAPTGLGSNPNYVFIAADRNSGDITNPALEIEVTNDNSEQLVLTHAQLDQALASLGYGEGEKAELVWAVEAVLENNSSVSNTYNINITRFSEGIGSFSIVSPASWTELALESGGSDIVIDWQDPALVGTNEVSYTWEAVLRGESFATPLLSLESDNGGTVSQLTLTQDEIDIILADLGVAESETAELEWRVKATTPNGFTSYSTTINKIALTRAGGIIYTLYVPAAIPEGYDVYIAGELSYFTGADWQQPGSNTSLMLKEVTPLQYQIVLPFPDADRSIKHKFFLAPTGGTSWGNGEQAINTTDGTCQNGGDRFLDYKVGIEQATAYVAKWENIAELACPEYLTFEVTVPASTPAGYDVYLAGGLSNVRSELSDWNQPGTNSAFKMNKTGDFTYSLTIPVGSVTNSAFPYKYFLATALAPNWSNGEQRINDANDGCQGIDNREATFDQSKVITDVVEVWEGFCPF